MHTTPRPGPRGALFRFAVAVALASCVSCSPAAAPAPAASQHTGSGDAPATLAPSVAPSAAPATPALGWEPFPTLQNAGAETCKSERTTTLGPIERDYPVLGFGPGGGLAAWSQDSTTLALQPLSTNGAALGPAVTVTVPAERRPTHVLAFDGAYVVVLLLWDWQRSDARWWGIVTSRDGQPRSLPQDLGLADMNVQRARMLDGGRAALVLIPAAIAKDREKLRGRWQTLSLRDDGTLESRPVEVPIDDLTTLGDEAWEPAALGDQRGWTVSRPGVAVQEGVFEGKRQSSAGATPLLPETAIHATVYNTAVPPPRGPGGTIYERLPRPALVRKRGEATVGAAFQLPASGTGFSPEAVWTGTHFLYATRTERDGARLATLVAIDCAP